eukprot:13035598-Alexandrium_andersonii.AAC.1
MSVAWLVGSAPCSRLRSSPACGPTRSVLEATPGVPRPDDPGVQGGTSAALRALPADVPPQ